MICSSLNSCEPPLSIRFTLPRHHGYFIIVFKLCQIKYLGGLGHHHHHPDHHQLLIRQPACQCCPSTWEWEWRGLSILPPATQTSPGFLFQNVLQGISSNTRGKLCGNATNVFFYPGTPLPLESSRFFLTGAQVEQHNIHVLILHVFLISNWKGGSKKITTSSKSRNVKMLFFQGCHGQESVGVQSQQVPLLKPLLFLSDYNWNSSWLGLEWITWWLLTNLPEDGIQQKPQGRRFSVSWFSSLSCLQGNQRHRWSLSTVERCHS